MGDVYCAGGRSLRLAFQHSCTASGGLTVSVFSPAVTGRGRVPGRRIRRLAAAAFPGRFPDVRRALCHRVAEGPCRTQDASLGCMSGFAMDICICQAAEKTGHCTGFRHTQLRLHRILQSAEEARPAAGSDSCLRAPRRIHAASFPRRAGDLQLSPGFRHCLHPSSRMFFQCAVLDAFGLLAPSPVLYHPFGRI